MNMCQHRYKTGKQQSFVCQDCSEVILPDPVVAQAPRQRRKKPLPAKDICYRYVAPVRICFHSLPDGEDCFIDTKLDIPVTETLRKDLEIAARERNTNYETLLEESLDHLLVGMKRQLARTLPLEKRQQCTITVKITGPITSSQKPLS